MNGIEERLKQALDAQAGTVRPHPGARAENARRLRRAKVRRRSVVPVVAVVAAAAAALPFAVPALGGDAPRRAASGPGGPGGPPVPGLVDEASVVRIPGRLPGGAVFRADALGTDGSVVGRSEDGRVWQAGPRGGTPRSLGVRASGGLTTGPGFVTWIARGGGDLTCRTPDGRTRVISPQGAAPDRPAFAGGGSVIASDPMLQPFVADGCARGRTLSGHGKPAFGTVKAFAHPTVFVAEPSNDRVLREVDVATGRIVQEHPLPAGVRDLTMDREEQFWQAAANDRYFAWAVDGHLQIVDRTDWRRTLAPHRPAAFPGVEDTRARLTAGDRLIVYSTITGVDRSLLYDTRTRTSATWPGEVQAAGDRLLWRDGDDYLTARVR
ncbi:hypothetical protein ACQEU3_04935 [Spirillospora sp. CA-253888]